MRIKLPWLLDGDMKPLRGLLPLSLSLTCRMTPLSTAVMTLEAGEARGITPGCFIRLQPPWGGAQVHRVQEVETALDNGTAVLRLSHGLCTLADGVVFGSHDFLGLDTGGDTGAVITTGVVKVSRAALREGPTWSAAVLTHVSRGEQVAITGAGRSWYTVTYGAVRGWMSKSVVENTGEPVLDLGEAVSWLLDTQSRRLWEAGCFSVREHHGITLQNQNALTALLNLGEVAASPCLWHTEQGQLPWRLSLEVPETVPSCELRPGRNLTELSVTVSRRGLCSRLYAIGKDGLTIEELTGGAAYLDLGGEEQVSRILLCPQEQNASALLRRAQGMAETLGSRHVTARCRVILPEKPEESDLPRPGALCRLILPEGSHCLRVTQVSWPDMLRSPGETRVILSAPQETASALLAAGNGETLV